MKRDVPSVSQGKERAMSVKNLGELPIEAPMNKASGPLRRVVQVDAVDLGVPAVALHVAGPISAGHGHAPLILANGLTRSQSRPTSRKRTSISFCTSAFGSGRSIGKCRALTVLSSPASYLDCALSAE